MFQGKAGPRRASNTALYSTVGRLRAQTLSEFGSFTGDIIHIGSVNERLWQ